MVVLRLGWGFDSFGSKLDIFDWFLFDRVLSDNILPLNISSVMASLCMEDGVVLTRILCRENSTQ